MLVANAADHGMGPNERPFDVLDKKLKHNSLTLRKGTGTESEREGPTFRHLPTDK